MPLSPEQQKECERIFNVIYSYKIKTRAIAEIFKDLPDRVAWPEYYQVIPEPRSLHGIRDKLGKGRYKSPTDVHSDLELVFANAIHFNEESSVISNDARTLQGVLSKEWETSVAAGALPKIDSEIETTSEAPRPQPSRASRTRDVAVAPPVTPIIRLPKKAGPSAAGVSRTATMTPVPQRTATPQHQSTPQLQTAQQLPATHPAPVPATTQPPLAPAVPAPTPATVPVPPTVPAPAPAEPEEDLAAAGLVRDKQADEIVSQLEATFPRWPGPGPDGWMELSPSTDLGEHCASILKMLKEFKDAGGDFPFDVFQRMPEETSNKTLSFTAPMSVSVIENKLRTQAYTSPAAFDQDLSRLFEKARKWHEEGTYPYGRVLVLQCLWQTVTSPKAEDMQVDVTVSNSTSESAESITFKGITYRVGDWVHLSNKDVPPKPIVAQIQRIDKSDPAKVLALTWYSRPEQTIHNATRSFWEREVFKTNFTSSNSIQEIIEPVACQFFPKHIRGRPSPPMWYPGRPLYVCESRYDSSSKTFSRIKNWSSCIPDGLRKGGGDGLGVNGSGWEYMPISKFDNNHTVVPRKHPSPFLKGIAGIKKRGHGGPATPGPQKDRSVITAAGGPTVITTSMIETLPEDTVKHFDRDPYTNQLLWFSGAPIETPRPRHPKHSLDYLYFLAQQQEKRHRGEDMDERKRKAAVAPPISIELANLHNKVFGTNSVRPLSLASQSAHDDVEMGS
ncbi:bromodomain domain protein [Rhizoctonia solani AG-3 Rhs1AP]|uniref:Bromodomain domain protein n=1 Tax=Rhizoctonia solani AG-3 Rhs1AP TaxID=1086054 RepID=X8JP42_9AGAM|nr:bromodomain domain protein [Rhizoctonia solani AG-3 Rhs1AP]